MAKILIVDDEQMIREVVREYALINGYEVAEASDGLEALELVEKEDFDCVILDIMMPKLDGISVLKQVRALGNHLPILMLTAKSEIDDRVNGLDSGADDYLTKPFSMKELLARIRAMTRRQAETTDAILSFGDVRLDRSTYQLSTDTGTLRLANKEYQMLEMLMTNPGQVISVEQFMDKIWVTKSGDTTVKRNLMLYGYTFPICAKN